MIRRTLRLCVVQRSRQYLDQSIISAVPRALTSFYRLIGRQDKNCLKNNQFRSDCRDSVVDHTWRRLDKVYAIDKALSRTLISLNSSPTHGRKKTARSISYLVFLSGGIGSRN